MSLHCKGCGDAKGLEESFGIFSRKFRSFSSLCARNIKSSGDSFILGTDDGRNGVGTSPSVAGGDGSWSAALPSATGDSPEGLERKLGMGRADGAGDAWKVAPANAVLMPGLIEADRCGGVWRPYCVESGDGGTFLDFVLFLALLLLFGCCDE